MANVFAGEHAEQELQAENWSPWAGEVNGRAILAALATQTNSSLECCTDRNVSTRRHRVRRK